MGFAERLVTLQGGNFGITRISVGMATITAFGFANRSFVFVATVLVVGRLSLFFARTLRSSLLDDLDHGSTGVAQDGFGVGHITSFVNSISFGDVERTSFRT